MNLPNPCRLLVIDDTPSIHDDFRKILAPIFSDAPNLQDAEAALFGVAAGGAIRPRFEIDHAHQGDEGLTQVGRALQEEQPYSVAFVDVRMPPGWDGIETITQLWKAQPDLQVVICTAYSDYSWSDIQQRLGPSDNLFILKKPFDNAEVLQLAQALTKKWRLARQTHDLLDNVSQLVQLRIALLEETNAKLRSELDERSQSE